MITVQISNIAANAALALLEKGLAVVPMGSTPLAQIAQLSEPIQSVNVPSSDQVHLLAKAIENVTSDVGQQVSLHGQAQDQLQVMLTDLVGRHLDLSRNIVKPDVVQFSKDYLAFVSTHAAVDIFADMCICVEKPADILSDGSFVSHIQKFESNASSKRIEGRLIAGQKTHEQVIELVLQNTNAETAKVREWLVNFNPEEMVSIWNDYFNGGSGTHSFDLIGRKNTVAAAHEMLLVFLAAEQLLKNPPEVEGESLTRFQGIASDYVKVAGFYLNSYAKQMAAFMETKRLVLEVSPSTKCVYVFEPVYQAWLDQGGKSDYVLALLLSNDRYFSAPSITENADKLKRLIETYATMRKVNEESKLPTYFRDRAEQMALTILSQENSLTKEIAETNPQFRDIAQAMIKKELANRTLDQLKDAHQVGLDLIAKCVYFYTPAYEILSDIHQAGRVNPDFNAGEAALVAAIRYMAKFMTTQMSVVRV